MASLMRRQCAVRASPEKAQALVDHGHRVAGGSHLGGAYGVKDRGADITGGFPPAIRRHLRPMDRAGIRWGGRTQARLLHQAPRGADRIRSHLAVVIGRKIIRCNRWFFRLPASSECARCRREVGCRLQALTVIAGKRCRGSPNMSSDSGLDVRTGYWRARDADRSGEMPSAAIAAPWSWAPRRAEGRSRGPSGRAAAAE